MKISAKFRNFYGPILLASIAFLATVGSIIKARVESAGAFEFTNFDYSAIGCASIVMSVAIYFAYIDYREKEKAAKFKEVRLILRRTRSQPPCLSTWSKDERFVSGILSIYLLTKEENQIFLFDTVIRYGELTSPESAAERLISRIVENNWEASNYPKGFLLVFEPTGDEGHVKTSALYDKDDLREYLFESKEMTPDAPQVLVLTKQCAARLDEYLSTFSHPDSVLTVTTNHRPYYEEHLPTLFNVIGEICVEINGVANAKICMKDIRLHHEYAIGANFEKIGIAKRLLDYSVSLEVPIC